MNKSTMYWLRWIAVIPAAFLIGLIASLIIREILFFTVFAFFPLHNPVEAMLTPLLNAAGFVFFGSLIAPERGRKSITVVVLLCIAVSLVFIILALAGVHLGKYRFQLVGGVTTFLVTILGACLGGSLAYSRMKRRESRRQG